MIVGGLQSPGVGPGDLVIDGPTLGKIFLGQVKTWDDAALKKLNPNAKLPSQAIAVVHRSDGSGTTFNFTDYLTKVSPDWKSKVGSATAVEWPMGIGAKGNEGVTNNVANTKGSIGYVEYAYAKQNKMSYAKMINKDGKTVAPTSETFQAAAAMPTGTRCRLWRDSQRAARCSILADDRRDVHPHPQAAAGSGGGRGSPQVLRLGLFEGRQDGGRPRFRADAHPGGRHHREDVGHQHQELGRQAVVCPLQLRREPSNHVEGAIRRLPAYCNRSYLVEVPIRCVPHECLVHRS